MGIFKSHHQSENDTLSGAYADDTGVHTFHTGSENTEHQSGTSSEKQQSSSSQSTSHGTHKSACGCGCGHKMRPIDDEVVEVKEEWDY